MVKIEEGIYYTQEHGIRGNNVIIALLRQGLEFAYSVRIVFESRERFQAKIVSGIL
jgi:hypothetical protein